MRKKSLPIGVVARRALCQGQKRTGSLENLLNECNHSQLENVKPPSIMDDLMDVADMENSMLSVASITSEIADSKENSLTKDFRQNVGCRKSFNSNSCKDRYSYVEEIW